MRDAIRTPEELLRFLDLPAPLLEGAIRSARIFPLLVPRGFAELMERGNPADPLLRQVLPLRVEDDSSEDAVRDAVGDGAARRAPGLIHKYAGRVLLLATGSCAVHCRYCFRRHYPYGDEPGRLEDWRPALEYIAADPTIHEVLLSGGDPLMLPDVRLFDLLESLEAIPHVERLRFHTRLPIVLPSRVTDRLVERWMDSPKRVVIVVHVNHARELGDECRSALQRLVRAGLMVLNQSVLLRGVNDSVESLATLSEALVNLGVLPYYIHQLDRVGGTLHFEVSEVEGRELLTRLRARLPGYAVPRYVREIPGEPGKSDVFAAD
jgi:EF-P beta-lysylation protein EpmB